MTRTRERWIERIRSLLEQAGYYVVNTHGVRPSSFDLAARRDATLLLIKVLKNIDALDSEEAVRLLELGRLFPATALVVGETSGASELDDGVVYTRYEVPIVTEGTLRDFLEKALPPFLYASPGGAFAQIDGERLRFLRQTRGLSLGTLASVAGVSRRAIQLYEEGQGAEATVVERIEAYLDAPIVRPVELFQTGPTPSERRKKGKEAEVGRAPAGAVPPARTGDPLRDGVLAQLAGIGHEVMSRSGPRSTPSPGPRPSSSRASAACAPPCTARRSCTGSPASRRATRCSSFGRTCTGRRSGGSRS